MLPFHLRVSLLNEIGSWVNFRSILNQFPQKVNVCFVYLQDHNEILLNYTSYTSTSYSIHWTVPQSSLPAATVMCVMIMDWHTGAQVLVRTWSLTPWMTQPSPSLAFGIPTRKERGLDWSVGTFQHILWSSKQVATSSAMIYHGLLIFQSGDTSTEDLVCNTVSYNLLD